MREIRSIILHLERMIINSFEFCSKVEVKTSKVISKMTLSYQFKVPKNLEKRACGIKDTHLPIQLSVVLKSKSPIIGFYFKVDNRFVDSHRSNSKRCQRI